MWGFDGAARRDNYLEDLVSWTEGELRMRKLKHTKAACKYEVTGEMIRRWDKLVISRVWVLFNMTFQTTCMYL